MVNASAWAGRSVEDRCPCKAEVVGSNAGQLNVPPGPFRQLVSEEINW